MDIPLRTYFHEKRKNLRKKLFVTMTLTTCFIGKKVLRSENFSFRTDQCLLKTEELGAEKNVRRCNVSYVQPESTAFSFFFFLFLSSNEPN